MHTLTTIGAVFTFTAVTCLCTLLAIVFLIVAVDLAFPFRFSDKWKDRLPRFCGWVLLVGVISALIGIPLFIATSAYATTTTPPAPPRAAER
jgi:hypothetical protein